MWDACPCISHRETCPPAEFFVAVSQQHNAVVLPCNSQREKLLVVRLCGGCYCCLLLFAFVPCWLVPSPEAQTKPETPENTYNCRNTINKSMFPVTVAQQYIWVLFVCDNHKTLVKRQTFPVTAVQHLLPRRICLKQSQGHLTGFPILWQ